jgi:hypothetical protein
MAKEKDREKAKDKKRPAESEPAPPGPPPRHVYRWDLDKTYLQTEFDRVRDLVRSAFEGAEKKRAVPGAAALLRELRKGEGARVCFISGSPRQMRKVLTEKLRLDGVEFDEFILKPNLRNFFRGRFRALRDQVGYKLPALLAGRSGCTSETSETCFGDDAEADAFVYSLYADLLAGRVDRAVLAEVMSKARVYPDDAARTLALADSLERAEVVGRIFIRLDRHSPTARFERYGRRLVPIYNYFQAALVLLEDGRLEADAAIRVALEMVDQFAYSLDALRNSLEDLLRRGRVARETVRALGQRLEAGVAPLGSLPPARAIVESFGARVREVRLPQAVELPDDTPIDYLAAFDDDVPKKRSPPARDAL